jgi:hypothetical protein
MAARTNTEIQMFRTLLGASLLSLSLIGIMSSPASAFTKIELGTRTKDYIKDLCKTTTGGKYQEGQGQYGCMSNCGGKEKASDACGINCNEKTNQCYGWSPGTEGKDKKPSTPTAVMNPAKP